MINKIYNYKFIYYMEIINELNSFCKMYVNKINRKTKTINSKNL